MNQPQLDLNKLRIGEFEDGIPIPSVLRLLGKASKAGNYYLSLARWRDLLERLARCTDGVVFYENIETGETCVALDGEEFLVQVGLAPQIRTTAPLPFDVPSHGWMCRDTDELQSWPNVPVMQGQAD